MSQKATELETDIEIKASILYALARCLYITDEDEKAILTAHQALGASDPDSLLWEDLARFIKRIK